MGKRKTKPTTSEQERARLADIVREGFTEIVLGIDLAEEGDESETVYLASVVGNPPVIETGSTMQEALRALAKRFEDLPPASEIEA